MVDVLMLTACEMEGVGMALCAKVGADVNAAANMLVLAVKCRESTVTEICTRRWECNALSNGTA